MSYSYSDQANYYNQPNYAINNKPSAMPAVIGGAVVGALGGTIVGACKKTPVNKRGEATDKFAKEVYEKSLKDEAKNIYNQGKNILKKIDKISTPDELKALINKNKKCLTTFCNDIGQSLESFLKNITDKNFKQNKKVIKERIVTTNNAKFQNTKNQIQACWNSVEKKFKKVNGVKDEIFKQIKNIKNPTKGKMIAKCAGIGALITGVLAFIGINLQSK